MVGLFLLHTISCFVFFFPPTSEERYARNQASRYMDFSFNIFEIETGYQQKGQTSVIIPNHNQILSSFSYPLFHRPCYGLSYVGSVVIGLLEATLAATVVAATVVVVVV